MQSNRYFTRLQDRYHRKGKILICSYHELFYINWFQVRAEYCWQLDHTSCYYNVDEAYAKHAKSRRLASDLFHPPYDYFRSRLKKPPDKVLCAVLPLFLLPVYFTIHILYGIIKIVYLMTCYLNESIVSYRQRMWLFSNSLGVDVLRRHCRARSKATKRRKRKEKYLQRLSKILALATVFSTTKNATVFTNRTDFNLNSILAVVDNCATATVLNNKSLFVGELIPTSAYSLVTVGGCDHRPTHYGPAVLTVRNDDDTVVKIPIPKALYFPTSPVNVISIGELS